MMGRKAARKCRVVIPIKLQFSASVVFIHKESVTMQGHTIVKLEILACGRQMHEICITLITYCSVYKFLQYVSIIHLG